MGGEKNYQCTVAILAGKGTNRPKDSRNKREQVKSGALWARISELFYFISLAIKRNFQVPGVSFFANIKEIIE